MITKKKKIRNKKKLEEIQNIIKKNKKLINTPECKRLSLHTHSVNLGSDIDCKINYYNNLIPNPDKKLNFVKLKVTKDT